MPPSPKTMLSRAVWASSSTAPSSSSSAVAPSPTSATSATIPIPSQSPVVSSSSSSSTFSSPRLDDSSTESKAQFRIYIAQAKGLASRDRNGYSDPYVKLAVGGHKFTTQVIHKSLNPVWDAAFDFEIEAQSLPDQIVLMFWDKDRWGRDDFLGTVHVPFEADSIWADGKPKHYDDKDNEAMWFKLTSIPGKFSKITGEVNIKLGFLDTWLAPVQKSSRADCLKIWEQLIKGRNKLGLGQRQVDPEHGNTMLMADIPIAAEDDSSLDLSALRIHTPSPPPTSPSGTLTASTSYSSSLSASSSSSTLHGVVFMEIVSASNLPRNNNLTRTGFDMDAFVVVSFGKYIFRTRVIRHNLNPVWKGKLMFRVHHGEDAFKIKYSVHDWDKLSGNDFIGSALMDIDTLINTSVDQDMARSPSPSQSSDDEKESSTGASPPSPSTTVTDSDMKEYNLKIELASNIKASTTDSILKVQAKFVPYTRLRRRFWLGLAKAFDAGQKNGMYSKVLIQAMLEGLGSNLSSKTVDSFFTPYNKDPERDELTFDQLFERLERQVRLDDSLPHRHRKRRLRKFWSKKKKSTAAAATTDAGASPAVPEPVPEVEPPLLEHEVRELIDEEFGEEEEEEENEEDEVEDDGDDNNDDDDDDDDDNNELFMHLTEGKVPENSSSPTTQTGEVMEPTEADFDQTSDDEYVIRISTCPICQDPSLGAKLETDVITHIAVCAGNDGFNLEKLILGNFVTEANAQRKWITKVVKTFGYGRYMIGKNNANIIVQDRTTGVMLEEKMPMFIRLGIRLLYKSPAQKIRVSRILANMSKKQGRRFDDPRSKRNIEPFIRFHNLEAHMAQVLEPVHNFKSFNEFFYRKLKPDARTLSNPGDDRIAVSVADCRMTCFQTIADASKFWIKGRQFTIGKLLGDEGLAKKYDGGSLAIFRLAPQDYHRYHIPVRGTLSEPRSIDGEYFTVNPMAIRSRLDVYGENKRVVSTIESKEFGTVAYVTIGAMMVGSIVLTTKGGQAVERMDEHGYFAFGGSTIVVLFEPNTIQFDEDLLRSSKEQIEMLVRVGMKVGVSTR
ncbi:hypothetical protein BG004_004962 [Podila humilis]|nr:hypothetical protein BG004_004962 [Podila humilis]